MINKNFDGYDDLNGLPAGVPAGEKKYKCAGAFCDGYSYKASDIAHPAKCNGIDNPTPPPAVSPSGAVRMHRMIGRNGAWEECEKEPCTHWEETRHWLTLEDAQRMVREEREACAQECDAVVDEYDKGRATDYSEHYSGGSSAASSCEFRIRARSAGTAKGKE